MREIIGEADNAQKALNELDKAEMELARKSDDELAQMDKSLGRGTPQPNSNESVTQQSLNKAEIKPKNSAETKLLNEIDPSSLNDEQKAVFEVLTGQKDKIILQGKNLNDLYILERGTRQGGARKIITKHGGVEKTGGLSNDEILDMMKVVRNGELDENSFTQHKDFIRYAYDLKDENGLNLRLVVDEYNDGKKVFDFYSNRNFTDYDGQSWQKNENIQMPKKSLLEQARENTERLRAAQEAAQIAQKEAELARLKEMQAKNAEILAQKEAAAGQAINEAQSLEIGTPIKAQKISDTKIIINDNTAPFKAEFIIAKKDDIKPNFERTGTQGRSERQDKVIESIQSDFKPHLIFEQMGGFEGLPIILKDGQVIAGNHRAQAIKGLTGENLARYKQAAKEKFGIDLKDDEVIVRLVKDGDEKELINLAFMSNVGRESNLGEKALANLAKYESNMQNLPNRINADSVFELESQVAKALDTQGNGLNVFDTNLALLSKIAKSTHNANILDSLNALKNLSQDEKEKVLRMFVSNAGEFLNIAKDTELKSLNLNDYLADALIIAAKNVDEKTRKANFQSLFSDIQTMLASAKEMLKIDPFLFENFKSKALGYALARFARLENPAGKLFDFLKASKADLENLYTGGLFDTNKAISDIDIYDFLKHAINSGDDLMDNGVNLKHAITSKLDDLRKVENALIDSGEIQFAKSKAKPQGREAKETNINSLFADDELQMQATKPTKELNLSDEKDFNELGEFFKLNLKDKEFNEIYNKAAATAQRLGVKVRFDESAGRSHFVLNDNTITIAAANKELFQAQDLLHELIHATTRKALKDFNQSPEQAAKIYTKRQIEAINEINSLYQKSKGIAKRQGKDAYALQNVDEFVAELSSSEFRAFLKAQDIFERFIKALIRFFTGDSERLAKNVNSYKALKESYYKILDDYEPPLAPQKIADERALKGVDELNLSENLGKTEQDYTNAYFQKLKKENPNLSDEQLLDKLRFDKEVIKGSIEWLKSNTKIFYGVLGYSKTDAELENFFRGGTKTLAHRRKMIENYYNITPLKEFGTNYAEFYRDSKNAVRKLFFEAKVAEQSGEKFNGQVAGAFYRQDLGDIDLVWGNDEIGLKKIIDKHLSDFADFKGDTAQDKLANALGEIVKDGKVHFANNIPTIYHKKGDEWYLVGLSKGFNGTGDNLWVITSYKKTTGKIPDEILSGDTLNLSAYKGEFNPPLTSGDEPLNNKIIPNSKGQSQADESQVLSAYDKNILENAPKETIEAHLKSIEKDIDYLEKGIDFYKKNPEQDYNGEMIKFNEKLLTPKLQMQKAYKQRLDELNSLDLSYAPKRSADEVITKIQEKFKFDEKKAKDLFEWHKDSSPLTKNDDGTPKVFYHGSPNEFEVFDIEKTRGELGHYFTDNKSYAEQYMRDDNGKLYAVFLKSKNIISLFDPKAAQKYKKIIFGDDLPELEKILKERYKSSKVSEYDLDNYKSAFYDLMRKRNDKNVLRVPSIIGERLKTAGVDGVVSYKGAIVVFDSKQIKSIDNAGSWTDSAGKITKEKPSDESARHSYFNAQSPNILHSNEIWGGGLAGGTLNGLETDEDGNIIGFDPAKFVAGFIAGAAGTKAVKLALQKNPNIRAKAERFVAQSGEFIKNELQNSDLPRHARRDLERIFGKALVNSLDNKKFIIAGENAIGANREKLAKAQVMSKKGIDESEIWDKTGWYLDKDGKWKFEINPQGGEIKLKTMPDDYESVLLKDLLKDNELFKAYPHLKEMDVFFDNTPEFTHQGQFARDFLSGAEYININKAQIKNYDDFKSILYHEIQHAVQSKEGFASGGNLDNGLYHYKNKLGEVEARNVQSRMSDLYKPDFKKYLREARKMYDESELSDEAIFNIWKKQNLDKYPHPKETIDVNYDEIITQDLPKTKEVNVLENLQKLKPETIDELREEWVTMTNAERGGYAKDELKKAMREKAAVFENDLNLRYIIMQDLNAQNGVSYGVDKDKLKNLGIMSAENLEKGQNLKLDKFKDSKGNVDKNALRPYAENMPDLKINSVKDFKGNFDEIKGKFGFIKTPYKDIKVNMVYAYKHFYENSSKQNRDLIKSAFFATFKDPLFITKNSAKGRDSVYFYKPFYTTNKANKEIFLSLFGVGIDSSGKVDFTTFYKDISGSRFKEMLGLKDENIIYIKE